MPLVGLATPWIHTRLAGPDVLQPLLRALLLGAVKTTVLLHRSIVGILRLYPQVQTDACNIEKSDSSNLTAGSVDPTVLRRRSFINQRQDPAQVLVVDVYRVVLVVFPRRKEGSLAGGDVVARTLLPIWKVVQSVEPVYQAELVHARVAGVDGRDFVQRTVPLWKSWMVENSWKSVAIRFLLTDINIPIFDMGLLFFGQKR